MADLDMIMNCISKVADDQEAVDAVTRQRDTITRTAADTEVLLPFAQDPDQASTAAPPDDERDLFGREEALRMDEEIMDFQWFEHVTWDSIKDLRGHRQSQSRCSSRLFKRSRVSILRTQNHRLPCKLQCQPYSCVRSSRACPYTTLRKMPRLSEPGPLGMRAEHWYDFGSLAGNSYLFVQLVAHIVAACSSTTQCYNT